MFIRVERSGCLKYGKQITHCTCHVENVPRASIWDWNWSMKCSLCLKWHLKESCEWIHLRFSADFTRPERGSSFAERAGRSASCNTSVSKQTWDDAERGSGKTRGRGCCSQRGGGGAEWTTPGATCTRQTPQAEVVSRHLCPHHAALFMWRSSSLQTRHYRAFHSRFLFSVTSLSSSSSSSSSCSINIPQPRNGRWI